MKLEFSEANFDKVVQALKRGSQEPHAAECGTNKQVSRCDCHVAKATEALRIAQNAVADAAICS